MDVVVSPMYIELSEEGAASKAVDSLRDEWGYIAVLLSLTVDWAVVLNRTEFAIFLFDKEEVRGIRAPRFLDGSPFQVFSYEFVNLLYFELSERE